MRVIAIDLDGTALEYPEEVNKLFDNQDNFIVIHTARPHYLRSATEKQLSDAGINYHCLKMDKVRADVYIDDKNPGGVVWPKFTKPVYND